MLNWAGEHSERTEQFRIFQENVQYSLLSHYFVFLIHTTAAHWVLGVLLWCGYFYNLLSPDSKDLGKEQQFL